MDRLKAKYTHHGGARGQGAAEARLFAAKERGSSLAMCSSRRAASSHPNLAMRSVRTQDVMQERDGKRVNAAEEVGRPARSGK